jgi:hypothetical protein
MKHTKGNWKIDDNQKLPLAIIVDDENGEGICEIGLRTEENKANAKLIAAAPELLEALKELLEVCPCQNGCAEDDMTCATQKAKSIIQKATS